ncbi:unnamed protein product, partial [Pylaiella littoralis]
MVAADMGHLKDTASHITTENMRQQSKDLAAVMDQLGPTGSRPSTTLTTTNDQHAGVSVGGCTDNRQRKQHQHHQQQLHAQQNRPPSTGGNDQQKIATTAVGSMPGSTGGKIRSGAVGVAVGVGVSDGRKIEAKAPTGGTANGEGQGGGGQGAGESRQGEGAAAAVWNAYQRGKWFKGQWIPKVLLDATSPDLSELVGSSQRRVLIMSEKRSGGQAMGGILNADPRVFYVADPCRMGGGPEALDAGACSLSISRLLACQPTINDIRNLFSFSYIVERSRVLSAFESLRWEAGGTSEENDEGVRAAVGRQCRQSSVVVVKETRLAEVAPRLSMAELGVEFLHIVRDPRAAIHGMAKLWQTSNNMIDRFMAEDCSDVASRVCLSTENKLKGLTGLGKQRFRVLKYEMVADAIRSVYTRGPTEPSPGTASWRGAKTTLGRIEWATRWAVEMPAFRRQQVQNACQSILEALGYDQPDPSEEEEEQQQDAGPESPSTQELGVVSSTGSLDSVKTYATNAEAVASSGVGHSGGGGGGGGGNASGSSVASSA